MSGLDPAAARGENNEPLSDDEEESRADRRRRSAEPLRASWRPAENTKARQSKATGLRKLTATFGWRAYLVPILLVVTVLVVFDTTRGSGADDSDIAADDAPSDSADERPDPVATEVPAEPVDLDIPTAKLPEGGDYSQTGEGTWHVVPLGEGSGKQAGDSGPLWTYTVEVEDGLDPASYAGDDSFAAAVESTLSDKRSWVGTGDVSLKRVDETHPDPDFQVSLASPETSGKLCGTAIGYESSCRLATPDGSRVVINLARWVRGAMAFNGDLGSYRQYVINHEVGHALGSGHVGCPEDGALAPVMMQQTFGVANDYVAMLNDDHGGDVGTVPADGKVCRPNPWPNPQPDSDD
ncbi:DUF3152 domain-containing protein [Saccharomonospora sp.]|uniref:DUF3152 domain-containing protein n=1 Tax=Saccharomonospora sp. TaxID=33913 RepID=UPI00261634C6|nr:DUF3152 domain-containing protein [Saccharomonospora sp.]